ncbi:MAG: aspartate 1-decarboxylase [Candidatus Omnitrophica bacterium]|nr:aspartate 1-decarboxylase [Candidatus Omnitrophota bacterium]
MAILRQMLKSKIHGAVINKKELHYNGSIGIDKILLLKSNMLPGEKVRVLNFNNGQRFETYIIEEKGNSGVIALYGPAARCGETGDKICIIIPTPLNDYQNQFCFSRRFSENIRIEIEQLINGLGITYVLASDDEISELGRKIVFVNEDNKIIR